MDWMTGCFFKVFNAFSNVFVINLKIYFKNFLKALNVYVSQTLIPISVQPNVVYLRYFKL